MVKQLLSKVAGTTLGGLVSLVTLIGVIASPVLAALFGGGWFLAWYNDEADGAKFELATLMLKITFPCGLSLLQR